jgi:cysteine desulfuration protein SufE
MSINEIQDKLIEDFLRLEDKETRQGYIDTIVKSLPPIEEKYKHDHYRVQGWMSDIWIRAIYLKEKVWFTAEGTDNASKGLLAMFVRVLSGNHPRDIADADIYFMNEISLPEFFHPLFAIQWPLILRKMKSQAVAYQIQLLQHM